MDKKYELMPKGTNELHRIRALRSFGNVKAGDIGGFIVGEHNLSHLDNCWVYEDAMVYMDAHVYGDAQVCGNSQVLENARVFGNALVHRNARVYGNAQVYGNARVCGSTYVSENSQIYENAEVSENARVFGDAQVCGHAQVLKDERVQGSTKLDRLSTRRINIIGLSFPITILDEVVHIGCKCLTTKEWIEQYREIGEKENFTPEQIEEYLDIILLAQTLQVRRANGNTSGTGK